MHQQEVGVWPQKLQCVPVNPGHPCTSSSLGAALTNHLQGLGEVAQLVRSLMAKSEFNIPGPLKREREGKDGEAQNPSVDRAAAQLSNHNSDSVLVCLVLCVNEMWK